MPDAVTARILGRAERDAALSYLERDSVANLFLMDLTARLGSRPAPGELATEIAGAWRGGELVGVAGLRPSVVFDAELGVEAVEALLPFLESLGAGLVKSSALVVNAVWERLGRRGRRRALIDRVETAYVLHRDEARLVDPLPGEHVRCAERGDLESLVIAARESLREEDRPDPFAGDIRAFRRWVRGRVERARVVEAAGRVVHVGYADVQRPEGWLLQGVYTFPQARRRGFGAAGVSALCREAFAAGGDHVQLSVVDGNTAGRSLYENLGFKPFGKLRTILFA